MTKNHFFNSLLEYLEIDSVSTINENTIIKELEEYDSFFALSIIAFVDENFTVKFSANQLVEMSVFGDLVKIIGEEKFDD